MQKSVDTVIRFPPRAGAVIIALSLALGLLASCEQAEYPYFIKILPASFSVAVTGNGSLSPCAVSSDSSPLSASVKALNLDGSVDSYYQRKLRLSLVPSDGAANPTIAPVLSANCDKGKLTIPHIAVVNGKKAKYKLVVQDEANPSVRGESPEFLLDLVLLDHFYVSPPGQVESPFSITVSAHTTAHAVCGDFSGNAQLAVTNGFTISPDKVKLSSGSWSGSVALSGGSGSDFTITATLATDQAGSTCLSGGGGGGGGGGGAGDGGAGSLRQAGDWSFTVTPNKTVVRKNEQFDLLLSITKKDSTGASYSTFSGTVAFVSDKGGGPTPASYSPNALSYNCPGTSLANGGKNTITANLTDSGTSQSKSATCIVYVGDVGIYGDAAVYLQDALNAESALDAKGFIALTSLDGIADLGFLIVNKAGSAWQGSGILSHAEIDKIFGFAGPLLLAHDSLTVSSYGPPQVDDTYALTKLVGPRFGVTGIDRIFLDNATAFVLADTVEFGAGGATAVKYGDRYSDGFLAPSGQVVTTTLGAQTYALIVAKKTSPKAILMSEALYHPYLGDQRTEWQWWGTDLNHPDRPLAINIINWLVR